MYIFQFRFATGLDIGLIFLGIFCACANGCALPAMIIVFGDMIDAFIGDGTLENIPWSDFNTSRAEAMENPAILT